MLLIYLFGILTTRLLGHPYREIDPDVMDHFGTVSASMFTLFTVMTTEGWADVARTCMKHQSWSAFMFVIFMTCTTFAIMNVVVAVIVENTLDAAVHQKEDLMEKEEEEKRTACNKIGEVFRAADADGNGVLTKEEFIRALELPEVMKLLHEVGIDLRQAENLFDILDYDGSGSLDVAEFVEGVMKARGDAKAKDVLAVQCDFWRTDQKVNVALGKMQERTLTHMEAVEAGTAILKDDLAQLRQIMGWVTPPPENFTPSA